MQSKLLLRRARIYIQKGKYQAAEETLSDLLRLDPSNRQAEVLAAALECRPLEVVADKEVTMKRLMSLPIFRPAAREYME